MAATERVQTSTEVLWQPNPGPQERALASTAFELLFGGSAGGGKTEYLLMGPLRYVAHSHFTAILFRRTFKELESTLVKKSWEYYPHFGARYSGQKHCWYFPSGAQIYFSHLEHEHTAFDHKSSEYQYIGFDELTSFTEFQYRYLLSRARSAHGLPIEIRSASNPEPNWVKRRWAPWVDRGPDYEGVRAMSGELLWYVTDEHDGTERFVPRGTPEALSRTFVRADLRDNPKLDLVDPAYRARLAALDPVQRARLRDGDWSAVYAAGKMFKRGWFKLVDAVPVRATRVRWWDRAATEEGANKDPDWTVGLLLARDADGLFYVEDVIRFRGGPGEVERRILETAELDARRYPGILIALPEDPGQAGKFEAAHYVTNLARFNVKTYRETGSKIVRASPASAQAEHGNIRLVRAAWNEALLSELEQFPDGQFDDQVDALSGAYQAVQSWAELSGCEGASGEREARDLGGF
jgi:predicted phage terminase large subunit-like protein